MAGAAVAVTARSEDRIAETVKLIEEKGGKALAITGDVIEQSDVERIVTTTENILGPIDILVNNAGVSGGLGKVWELEPAQWWRALEVNMQGTLLFSHSVLKGMTARKQGRIINLSSGAAHNVLPSASAYCASKAAIAHFTRCLASETKEYGISVFAYNPGLVRTPATEYVMNSSDIPEDTKKVITDGFDQGLDAPMEESVAGFMFLASGRADIFTGKHFSYRDDETDLLNRVDEIQKNDLYTVGLRI